MYTNDELFSEQVGQSSQGIRAWSLNYQEKFEMEFSLFVIKGIYIIRHFLFSFLFQKNDELSSVVHYSVLHHIHCYARFFFSFATKLIAKMVQERGLVQQHLGNFHLFFRLRLKSLLMEGRREGEFLYLQSYGRNLDFS